MKENIKFQQRILVWTEYQQPKKSNTPNLRKNRPKLLFNTTTDQLLKISKHQTTNYLNYKTNKFRIQTQENTNKYNNKNRASNNQKTTDNK